MSPATPQRFAGKVAVVTGAAQGIGRGVAQAIAAEGGVVIAVDRSPLVKELLDAVPRGQVFAHEADLETFDGAVGAVAEAIERAGRVDILVNTVGGTIWAKPFDRYEEQEIRAEINRSLFPTLWCTRAALPHMLQRDAGVIVNVSSIATRSVNRVPYAAAKGGVNAITASLAMETAGTGVRVVATAPGGTEAPPRRIPRNTEPQSPEESVWYEQIVEQTVSSSLMGRYGTIEEQVAPILFLASDDASYITGTTLPVGGGDLG
jgi:dihydroxycyclohexadiene carboxylate dehydrogenase